MKYRSPCWDALGIEPVSDQRAIRVAYTRKLKSIDPETDPQAFIALREAFERAQIEAQWVDLPDDEDDEEGEVHYAEDWNRDHEEAAYGYNPITGQAIPLADAANDEKYHALTGFLLPEGTRRPVPLDDAEARELRSLFEAGLADPRMEQVGFHADAERWFAELLARAWPASDAVLLAASRQFGWGAGADPAHHISPAIDFINARLRDAGSYGAATGPSLDPPKPTPSGGPAWQDMPVQPIGFDLQAPHIHTGNPPPVVPSGPDWQLPPAAPIGFTVDPPTYDGTDGARFEPLPFPGAEADAGPARPSPWEGITPEQANAHALALSNLLHAPREENQWATAEEREAMLAHWRALSGDPRLQEVSYFADAERWFANLIAHAVPFSDPLVMPATQFFGWLASDGSISQSWALATLTQRYRMLQFMEAVQQPKHPLNPAWRELMRPADERLSRGSVSRRKVRDLLAVIRRDFPDLEGCFDSYRVALWEKSGDVGGSGGIARWIFPVLFLLFIVVRAITAGSGSDPSPQVAIPTIEGPAPRATFYNRDDDLDPILARIEGPELTMDILAKRNPALHAVLAAEWDREKVAGRSSTRLANKVRSLLDEWRSRWVRRGGTQLLADHYQLQIEQAEALRIKEPAACARFLMDSLLTPDDTNTIEPFRARREEIWLRALLESKGPGARFVEGTRSKVPTALIDAAARNSGLSPAVIQRALLFEGPASELCAGRIAFMRAVLALPEKQKLPLMRVM